MNDLLLWTGRVAGLVGSVAAVVAVLLRASGVWHVGALPVGTLLNGGVAAMVLGTLAYAASLAERQRAGRP